MIRAVCFGSCKNIYFLFGLFCVLIVPCLLIMVYYLSMQKCEKEGRTNVRGADRDTNGYGHTMSFKLGQNRLVCNFRSASKRWLYVRIIGQRIEILTENVKYNRVRISDRDRINAAHVKTNDITFAGRRAVCLEWV